MESRDVWSCRTERPRLGFLMALPPFGMSTEGVGRISRRPDSIDSSLGASKEAADDTRGIMFTEQRRSVGNTFE